MSGEASFEALYHEHYRRVFGLCRQLLGSWDQAEDAAQEVFVRAHRSLGNYDPDQPFSRWVLKIASNYCTDVLRRRTREAKVFGSESAELAEVEAEQTTVLRDLVLAEQADEVKSAVASLPEKYRLPLVLAYYNESSYDEIATTLGITRTHVGALIYRGKQKLRSLLHELEEER